MIKLIGFAAAFCTTAAFIPQAWKTIKTRDTSGISLWMYLIFTLGVLLWLLYGLALGDLPIIAANAITSALAAIILAFKIKHK
jgi:MtN3 and saliva related transmembrane protein